MDPSMLAAAYVAFSPFYLLSTTALNMAKAVDQFRPVFIPPDGPMLCGVGPPTTYFTWLENFRLCSYKCTFLRNQCWFFNFKDPPGERTMCEIFDYEPPQVTIKKHCVMFKVSHVISLFAVTIRIGSQSCGYDQGRS